MGRYFFNYISRVKKCKICAEKISELILKGKLRFHQLAGIDPGEIGVINTNVEIASSLAVNEHWQEACTIFLGEISNKYSKNKRF